MSDLQKISKFSRSKTSSPKDSNFTSSVALNEVENDRNKIFYCLLAIAIAVPILSLTLGISVWLNFKSKSKIYIVEPDNSIALAAPDYDNAHRAHDAIAHVGISWLKLSYEFDLNSTKNNKVPCVTKVKVLGIILPCKTYDASFLLSPKIRLPVLAAISTTIPDEVYKPNGIFSVVKVYFTSHPRKKSKDTYEIDLIASRIDFKEVIKSSGLIERTEISSENLNSTLTLKSTPPNLLVLKELEKVTYRKKIHSLLSSGLVITNIEVFEAVPEDFKDYK